MKTCPHMSNYVRNYTSGVSMHYHDCIGSQCQIWDDVNNRCGAQVSDTIQNKNTNNLPLIDSLLGNPDNRNHDSLINYLQNIIGIDSERDNNASIIKYLQNVMGKEDEKDTIDGVDGSSLLRNINHVHSSHWHPHYHTCEEIPTKGGYPSGHNNFSTPYATVLITEYMSSQDLDGNGFIYGKDFMISDSIDKPIMIKSVEMSPEWEDPDISVSWQSMLRWSKNARDESMDPLDEYR